MRRTLLVIGALVAMTALPGLAHAQQPDPFADENNTTSTSDNSSDPFSNYEQSRNDSFQAKQNATKDTSASSAANTTTTKTTPTTAAAAPEKGTPGFEVIAAIGAVAAAMLVLRRR